MTKIEKCQSAWSTFKSLKNSLTLNSLNSPDQINIFFIHLFKSGSANSQQTSRGDRSEFAPAGRRVRAAGEARDHHRAGAARRPADRPSQRGGRAGIGRRGCEAPLAEDVGFAKSRITSGRENLISFFYEWRFEIDVYLPLVYGCVVVLIKIVKKCF